MILWESDYRVVNGRTAFIVIVRTVNIYENHHPEVVANEIYARTMHPLPMAAEDANVYKKAPDSSGAL